MYLMAFLLGLTQSPIEVGLAARYGYPGDPYAGKKQYACQKILMEQYGRSGFHRMLSMGLAHRTLPCGTSLIVCLSDRSRCTRAYVVDRGPFGALDEQGRWHARRTLHAREHWRGIVDALPGVAKSLKINGLKEVSLFLYPSSPSYKNSAKYRLSW